MCASPAAKGVPSLTSAAGHVAAICRDRYTHEKLSKISHGIYYVTHTCAHTYIVLLLLCCVTEEEESMRDAIGSRKGYFTLRCADLRIFLSRLRCLANLHVSHVGVCGFFMQDKLAYKCIYVSMPFIPQPEFSSTSLFCLKCFEICPFYVPKCRRLGQVFIF